MTTYELVRAILQEHAQDSGISDLSVKQLCAATGRSHRSVQMSLRTLRQQGFLSEGVHLGEGSFIRLVAAYPKDTQMIPPA